MRKEDQQYKITTTTTTKQTKMSTIKPRMVNLISLLLKNLLKKIWVINSFFKWYYIAFQEMSKDIHSTIPDAKATLLDYKTYCFQNSYLESRWAVEAFDKIEKIKHDKYRYRQVEGASLARTCVASSCNWKYIKIYNLLFNLRINNSSELLF